MRKRNQKRLPADLEAYLALGPGEHILADAASTGERWSVGTESALYLSGDGEWRRLPWEAIERAEWDSATSALTLVEVTDWGQPEIPIVVTVVDGGRLIDLVRERVTKSVVIRVFAAVHGRKGLSVVGRRAPTGKGDVTWSYVLAAGLDPADPLVAEVADRTLEEARAELAWL
jgi:hypothetical protein